PGRCPSQPGRGLGRPRGADRRRRRPRRAGLGERRRRRPRAVVLDGGPPARGQRRGRRRGRRDPPDSRAAGRGPGAPGGRAALAGARFDVTVNGDDPADDVQFLLGPNPGEPLLPLAKTASGGELARAMLALRLVLTQGPPTLVFDEVDAGVGGEAALAVGRAL